MTQKPDNAPSKKNEAIVKHPSPQNRRRQSQYTLHTKPPIALGTIGDRPTVAYVGILWTWGGISSGLLEKCVPAGKRTPWGNILEDKMCKE